MTCTVVELGLELSPVLAWREIVSLEAIVLWLDRNDTQE